MNFPRQALFAGLACMILYSFGQTHAEVKDYSGFVQSIILIDGLALSKKQAGDLLRIAREAVDEKQKIQDEILEEKQDAMEAYKSLKRELAAQQPTENTENTEYSDISPL